jgi:hypothetical protein
VVEPVVEPVVEVKPPEPTPAPTPSPAPPSIALPAALTGGADAVAGFLESNPRIVLLRLEVHASDESAVQGIKDYLAARSIAGERLEVIFVPEGVGTEPYVDAEIVKVE